MTTPDPTAASKEVAAFSSSHTDPWERLGVAGGRERVRALVASAVRKRLQNAVEKPLPATPPADDESECEDGVFGSQDIANALGGIGPDNTPDATDSEPLSEDRTMWLALRQTLVAEWRDDYSVVSIVDALTATAERIVAAREAAAETRARAEGAAAERGLAFCDLAHDNNSATAVMHQGSNRTCIRLKSTGQWVYDPDWEA